MGLRANTWKYALVGGLPAIACYFALPNATSQDALYSTLGTLSVVAIMVGVGLQRPADRLGWYCLVLAGTCFTLGDDTWDFYPLVLHRAVPFPSFADALYLAGYPFLFAGVLRLTRDPDRSFRREHIADAAIVSMGALAISWHFLMNSYVHDATMSTGGMLVNLAYPIMDVALLFIVFRALIFGSSKETFHVLVAMAMIVMFVADFIYELLILHNNYATGSFVDGLYLLEYVLIAAAALHPSMAAGCLQPEVIGSESDAEESASRRRLPIVVVAGFIPPTMLIVTEAFGEPVNVLVLACLSVAVFAVICLRVAWMIDRINGQSLQIRAKVLEIKESVRELEASHLLRDELETNLRYRAFHDDLTGLANRAMLRDRVEQSLASKPRTGEAVALCLGDLDGFKTVNDTLGHAVGDAVLLKVGDLLRSIVRPGDTVARLGGDEFAVLMLDVGDPAIANEFANRVIATLHDAGEREEHLAGISISVGVAVADSSTSAEELISQADAAMYEAKANGKSGVEVFEPGMKTRIVERFELIRGFRGALERSEFHLDFQPIYSLHDARLHGFEALVRWQHPTRGLVPPLDFIPIAEETGFIVPLGRWILVEACERLAEWSGVTDMPLTLAVNLSRRQLVSPHLLDDVRTALALTGIDPRQLVLEVTESVLMQNPKQAFMALTELRALGIGISVDDFGTGYSSLSHLQRFPVDVLKIDKSFVDPLNECEPSSTALVTSIIELAHSLNLEVVAEGIEREDQFGRLLELSCDFGQGYLMAKPLGHHDAEDLVRSNQEVAAATVR